MPHSEDPLLADSPSDRSHRRSFFQDVGKLITGTVFNQFTSVLASPALSRLFSPESFGTYAVITSITNVIGILACLRYEYAILLPEKKKEAINVLGASVLSTLFMFVVTIALTIGAGSFIAGMLGAPDIIAWLWLVPLLILGAGIGKSLDYWNSRERRFGLLATTRATSGTVASAVQVGSGAIGHATAGGLILGRLVGSVIEVVMLGVRFSRNDRSSVSRYLRFRHVVRSFRRYWRFPVIDSWGALINSLSWQLPAFMFSAYFSPAVVGYYAFSYRIFKLPMSLVGGAISKVFLQRITGLSDQSKEFADQTEAVFRRLLALVFFPTVVLTLFGPDLFALIFGEEWTDSGRYLQILAPWMLVWFVSSPLSSVFIARERQDLAFVIHLAILVTRIISLVVGGLLDNVYLALALFAGSGVIVYGSLAVWSLRLANVPYANMAKGVFRYVATVLPFSLILVVLKGANPSQILLLLVSTLMSVAYLGVLVFLEPDLLPLRALLLRKSNSRRISGWQSHD